MKTLRRLSILIITTSAVLLSACAKTDAPGAANPAGDDTIARGREQLIRAFDAGWVRFVAKGGALAVLKTEPPNKPGASLDYMVRLADCLPHPELVRFPETPVGILKKVIETGEIRQLTQDVSNTPAETAYYFSGISDKYLRGVLDEIGAHYGVAIETIEIAARPGSLPSTSYLLDDEVDFISQMNATGGETQSMRRRISRRFTCTMSASSQFLQIPEDSDLVDEIESWQDLVAREDVRICSGPLSTQTVRAFLPNHKINTVYTNDLSGCIRQIETDRADIMINPLPDLEIAGIEGFESVATLLVAGTPLWVALEGVECPSDGNPKTEDECFETDPP